MTKEDIQNKIEEIALNGATDGCNLAYIEREAEKLADSIVNLCNLPVVSNNDVAGCDHRHHSTNGRYMLYEGWCEKCGTDISQTDC